jgi:uncharacterized repeat protein (TIGR01451 family)
VGERVRAKRLAQAESLADLVQARQAADPAERIILVGDFNAYEFNDGLVDSMNALGGTPPPDNETAVPGDGVDLVNPDLDNLFDTPPPSERYSYIFDGQTQNIDHVLVNSALIADTVSRRIEHPRINADFPAVDRNDPGTPRRLSDHDPVVGYFEVAEFALATLTITKVEGADPVTAGTDLTYTITLTNAGPDPADTVSWSDTLPAGTTFVSLVEEPGWSCSDPGSGNAGTVSCSIATMAAGSAAFTLTVHVAGDVVAGTMLSNTVNATSATAGADPSATETTTVAAAADLALTKVDGADPVDPGTNLTYTLTASNGGPSSAASVSVSDTLPAGTTFVSLAAPGGWGCTAPVVGSGGTVTCSIASFPVGGAVFTLVVHVPNVLARAVLSNTATLTSATTDSTPGGTSPTETTNVSSPASVTATKTVSGNLTAGGVVTYTIVLSNAGPGGQVDNPGDELTDVLPPELILQSAAATSGTALATIATNTVTWNGPIAAGGSVTLTIQAQVQPGLAPGTPVANQATFAYDADGDGSNEASGATDDPAAPGAADPTAFLVAGVSIADIPTLDEWVVLVLAGLLGLLGAAWLRRA